MDPTTQGTYNTWLGQNVYDPDGAKIGTIEDIYYDDVTGRPEWLAVKTGWFGSNVSFVPIIGTTPYSTGEGLTVNYDKATIKDAPNIDPTGAHLSVEEERRLYQHYNIAWDDTSYSQVDTRPDRDYVYERPQYTEATDVSREHVGEQEMETVEEVTTHAEVPKMGKETVETGKIRLRRYLVTEQVTMPVTHEEVRVERDVDTEVDDTTRTTRTSSSQTRRNA